MLIQLSSLRNNHLEALPKNISRLSKKRWRSLSAGIIKEVFIFIFIPKIVGQHGGGKKEEWEMVSVWISWI